MIRKKRGITIFNSGAQKAYNRDVRNFVNHHLLQTQNEGGAGYQNSLEDSALPDGWKKWTRVEGIVEEQSEAPESQLGRFDVSSLGSYERTVLSAIAWGNLNTLIIAGERGSGKTALVKRLCEVLDDPRRKGCGLCTGCDSPILIRIDFNHIGDRDSLHDLREAFFVEMRDVLRAHLRPQLSNPKIMNQLIKYIRELQGKQIFSAFDSFLGAIDSDGKGWEDSGRKEKVDRLYEYIASKRGGLRRHVELLMAVARFFRDTINRDNACFVVITDNLDVVLPEAQEELLLTILALQRTGRVRTLVPLRWSTFEQLRGQASFSYGLIPHRGPGIKAVLRARFNFFLANWDSLPEVQAIEAVHRSALKTRIKYFRHNLDRRLGNHLQWLSGRCVKLGLKIAVRVIVNATVKFDQDPDSEDDIVRALYVSDSRDQLMDPQDPEIFNVFSHPLSQTFTLLNLRILQLVIEFRNSPPSRTVANISSLILRTGLWEPSEVAAAFQEMAKPQRPLLFIDGRSSIARSGEDIGDILRIVFLTKSGEQYVKRLIREVTYFQEAAICVRWPHGTLPSELAYSSLVERFFVVFSCLRLLREEDIKETAVFREKISGTHFARDIDWSLYSSRVVYIAARAFLRIIQKQHDYDYTSTSALMDWLSLVLLASEDERKLLGEENTRLIELVRDYQTELKDWRRREHLGAVGPDSGEQLGSAQ